MPITENQLKGNWAEQYIAAKLSAQGCLIRHVPQGHDSGIDLYCEKVKDGIPYLHFWCQIKTSSKWKGKFNTVSYYPKKQHIEYWLKQPAPVLVFLVPDLREQNSIPFYICSAFHFSYKKSLLKITTNTELKDFLNSYLPYESFLWDLKNGKVSSLKAAKVRYKKTIPKGVAIGFEKKLLISILWTLHRLVDDFLYDEKNQIELVHKENLNEAELNRINQSSIYLMPLEELVSRTNDKHYHYYETIGKYYELDRNYDRAIKLYGQSLQLLQIDPNKVWELEIKRVQEHLARVETKKQS